MMLALVRFVLVAFTFSALAGAARGLPYVIDQKRAEVRFSYSIALSSGIGRFSSVSGTADINDKALDKATVEALIDTRTLRTSDQMWEGELRGADFGFWIHDLSLKDPFYVTPLLMGATMFLQQWMTPTSADPMQQRMMMFMPLVLTAVFLRLPSGLAIYYLVSNLCQIGQQYVTNRTIGRPPAAVPLRSAGEKRLKNAGGGKTPGAASIKQGERRA